MEGGEYMVDKYKLLGAIASAGLSQKDLAKKIGVSKNTINSKINGKNHFNTEQIDRICEVLKIDDDTEKARIFLAKTSHNRDNERRD